MSAAYNPLWLYNLMVVKETKRWFKHHFISNQQFESIKSEYPSSFYHPTFIIRVLLFVATVLALCGVIGLVMLVIGSSNEEVLATIAIVVGLMLILVLESFFIKSHYHYKSGVTEALLYFAIGFFLGGLIAHVDANPAVSFFVCIIVFTLAAIRYLDLLCTVFAMGSFCCFLFYEFYVLDGLFRSLIPFVFILVFLPIYVVSKNLKEKKELLFWKNNLLVVEALSLLLIYAGGNYFVVREMSNSMMNLNLQDGQDIPFAFVFYVLTAVTPALYLYIGIRKKDKILIRISLLLIALSAFTFKYYFSFGHPEITLTIAGTVVLTITLLLLNYLRILRHNYTRENLMSERWGDMNLEAFIISQTVGGNVVGPADHAGDAGGGGRFGGGGSTDNF